jgi:hypothetical protein
MASKAPQPSMGPAGVPPSNTKYIVIAVLLLLLIGAVIVWQVTKKPPEPPPPVFDAGVPSAIPSGRNPDDDVPPPPPVEDAGPDAGKKIIYTHADNQCDAKKCTGSASGELETMLAFRVKQSHRCYDQALAQDATLKGKMSVAVRVGANGQVCNAGVASNEMGSPTVANCVVNYFRGANFPPPKGGCADINIPINFVPRQ